ncbi:MAG TPA: penicillin acylase family protein [Bryobacteraceae bacterium]|nr:penicillin acylase family protein [Bryobacteraceae bacterium]
MKPQSFVRLSVFILAVAATASAADPLSQQVTVYRDNYGVPHIVGETEEATFFGYGYAQAEDHLERMMLQYRDAQGRRAEVQGFDALGDGYLHFIPYEYRWDGDYLQRLLRTKKCVVENKSKIDPNVYKILAAFARGVNAYIGEHRGDIPAWIDSIAAEDVEALERSHYMRFYSIHDALGKMTEKVYDFPNFGSNQWAIAPFKSASGRIMHVEHTHMPWANRFQNYEAHLITPGKLDAAGISWFGSPFFLDGLNDKITWSATWNEPNMADVYEEKINPENHLQYLYEGQWRDIRVDTETFRVKGPKGMESITLPLYYTHHGPIVHFDREKNRAYSVKLPNYEGVNYSTGMYGLMKARNLAEFKGVLTRQLMPRWNLLFSDSENIFWVHNGNVAHRADGYDWSKPVPGWTKETEWGAYFPFELYPQLLNPPSGFLQNCNNPPWVVTKNSGLNPLAPAPYYLRTTPKADAGEEALNTRAERLFQVLGQDKKFTLADMKELAFDTTVMPADVIVPLLERAYRAKPSSEAGVARALELVKAWDRRSAEDSVAYTYVYYWGREYQELFSEGKFSRFVHYGRRKIDLDSPEEQDAARRAFEAAVARIRKQFGKSEVRWGDINVVVRGGKYPMDGTGLYDVLHPDEGPDQDNGQMYCNDGWGDLLIVVEGNPKEIWSLLPYGESEHASSPHYSDLAKLHSQRQAKRFWFTPADILAHTESVWGERNRINALLSETAGGQ